MKNKKSSTWYRKKGCEKAKAIHRKKFPYCEICGKKNCKIDCHHILTVGAYPEMSNQDLNLISLCVHCHKWGKISFHGSGTDLMKELFNNKFPNRIETLRKESIIRKHCDYREEYEELLAVDK